jgi:hypothetical protein
MVISGDTGTKDADPFGKNPDPDRSVVLSGKFVHNVGNLQMNITNWGFVGSLPKSHYSMADVPSAQYPAGSGIEYLYAAGLWVGAEKSGIPFVTTGYPETEFYPEKDPRDTIYRSFEGDPRGGRYPGPADDDGDGLVDEDFPDGYDDDGDGLIDEDFAAVGKQMFTCRYYDNLPYSQTVWPEHEPLGLEIRQETFQWGEAALQDFIGVRYTITNLGSLNFMSNIYVGIYGDFDAGPREYGSYHMDDQAGFYSGTWCARRGEAEVPISINVAYIYDGDGDGGVTPSYFGITLLGHITDPNMKDGLPYYNSRLLCAFRLFKGLVPFINGGDPTNDYERYEVMSTRQFDANTNSNADYRLLLSCGPFSYIAPGNSIFVDFAFVAGDDLDDLLDNVATAQLVWEGTWYNLDGNPETGIDGRESPVIGPIKDYDPDFCDGDGTLYDVEKGDTMWSNLDCFEERRRCCGLTSCYREFGAPMWKYQTGVFGKEHRIYWITGSAPVVPNMRLVARDKAVEVYWDDLSEVIPDPVSLIDDFEGYQIWRADDWHRPAGTTEATGPRRELWSLLESRDIMNSVPPNEDFLRPESAGGWIYTPLDNLDDRESYLAYYELALMNYPDGDIPCPAGLTEAMCDTLEALARRNLGLEGGKRYYRYIDYDAKNGLPYFYSVASFDHSFLDGVPHSQGRFNTPSSNFQFIRARTEARAADSYSDSEVYVVPNPVTDESMQPWHLEPNNADATGHRCEFRNLPRCRSTIRIYTIAGDLVQVLHHDGSGGGGTAAWNLVSRNGQDVTSGVYMFSIDPESSDFPRSVGKFVIIR